ncbi:MAG: TonB-dependent receptor [Gemmatimonadales bacterium]|nr:TonB-dependent receptor [Gemmatimonadales bacterium]
MKLFHGHLRSAILTLGLLAAGWVDANSQGVTGSAVQGRVTRSGGGGADGALVELRSAETGQTYTANADSEGRFFIDNVQPGTGYVLTIRAIGFRPSARPGIALVLGQRLAADVTLQPEAVQLEEIEVVATGDPLLSASRTGPSQQISDSAIARLPLQGRNFTDLIQISPQVVGTSVAGQNNRYNNLQVDGGVNNDVFGLAETGSPGGQARARPISVEAVKEFQVLVAPFDVRQGSFSGGLVNTITKSGTNNWTGSIFGYYQDKGISGFRTDPTFPGLSIGQYGGSLGGPIVRDRLHFFTAVDIQDRDAPFSSNFNLSGDDVSDLARTGFTLAQADRFRDILAATYGVTDVGDARSPSLSNPNVNIFGKLDWQLGRLGLVEASYNFVDASRGILGRLASSPAIPGRLRDGYQLSNSGYEFENTTNTARIKWTSQFGSGISNEFLAGYSAISDLRKLGSDRPLVLVRAGQVGAAGSWLAAGAERFSQLNSLDQNVFSIQNNLSFGSGAHRFTVGTANEFYKFDNAFFQAKIGVWAFNSLDSLEAGLPAAYQRRLATAARPEGPVATFNVQQIGVYAQDEWTPNNQLTLTAGLRIDVPFSDKPAQNPALAANPALPINTADFPTGNVLWSPRLGMNFDPTGRGLTIVRGGVGYFTGRPPYVWLSNAFVNTGLEQVELTCATVGDIPVFTVDPASQPSSCPSGAGASAARPEPNYFEPDFKFPQTFRISLGADQRLPGGLVGTVDLLYSKNVNQLYVQDANLVNRGVNSEGRFMYGTIGVGGTGAFAAVPSRIAPSSGLDAVGAAVLHTNTSAGRTYSGTVQLQKSFSGGVELNAGYTYSNTTDAISLTSSQAFSNYQFAAVDGPLESRNPRTSVFNVPHKFTVSGTVNLPLRSSFSLIYLGRAGDPYAWIVNGDANADGINGNDIPFIPADPSQITLVDPSQFAALDQFISSQDCLAEARGGLMERNSCRNPWQNYLNARLGVSIPTVSGQGIELSLDLFNVLNFMDHDWGLYKQVSEFEEGPRFLSATGFDAANNRPIYRFSPPTQIEQIVSGENTAGVNRSRWTMQVGARYRF